MPLARNWVERIHTRLLARYGSAWIALYRGIDPELVIADWAAALNGFGADTLVYALETLPDEPPNAGQFAKICMRGPQSQAPALPEPPRDPAIAAAALASITRPTGVYGRQWAHVLRERENRGDKLTLDQRQMWRAALPETGAET